MFAGLMGINQVLVKLVNDGMSPLCSGGGALLSVRWWWCWCLRWRCASGCRFPMARLLPGVLCGSLFAIEFMLTFVAFDYTTVARVTMLFYTMPFWLALIAHFRHSGRAHDADAFYRPDAGVAGHRLGAAAQRPSGNAACAMGRYHVHRCGPCAGPVSRLPCG
jgi:hypothetical protein